MLLETPLLLSERDLRLVLLLWCHWLCVWCICEPSRNRDGGSVDTKGGDRVACWSDASVLVLCNDDDEERGSAALKMVEEVRRQFNTIS